MISLVCFGFHLTTVTSELTWTKRREYKIFVYLLLFGLKLRSLRAANQKQRFL